MSGRSGARRYLLTALCARLADEGVAVAVILLAVHRTGGAAQGALVLTAWMAPHVLAAPLTGAVAARARRPRLLYAGALGGFALSIAALALGIGRLPLPLTLVVAAAGGCCGPIVSGGLSSLITRLLPAGEEQDRAYSWDAVVYNVAGIAGPGTAGLAASYFSPTTALLILAGTAACACALVTTLRPRAGESPTTERTPLRRDLVDGATTVWKVRELRAITAATCLAFTGIGALTTTAVLLATRLGHPGAGGLLMTAFAVGALVGTLGMARWRNVTSSQRSALVGLLVTAAGLAAATLVSPLPLVAACYAVAGAGDGLVLTATLRLRAEHAPPRWRPQVFTIGAGLKITAAAAGSALAGTATVATAPWYLLAAALTQAAAALLYHLARRDTRRTAPADPAPGPLAEEAGSARP
ncbi:MFS transporter [Streptomyces sp. NPDC048606]|uniref:MFS transporter n=1 Tax=Streptomyces sp. NPDC048606 TaxID=3154726 RepID=UPI0034367A86